jgi:spoIIIJ-associated protein
MPNSVEVRARTKDEAIRQALDELGVTRDDVVIEVLEEGRSGVFGVGSQDARVRVTILEEEEFVEDEEDESRGNRADPIVAVEDDLDEEEDEDEYQPEPTEVQRADAFHPAARTEQPSDEEDEVPEDEEELAEDDDQPRFQEGDAEIARSTLEHMLDSLEFPNVVTVNRIEHEGKVTNVHLDVAAEDVGLMIGRRGETLANLQFLVNACLTSQLGRATRVIVDIEHYRDRREQSLRGIAMRAADRVRRERRPQTLAPMPPNERRVIHLALQDSPYVVTESTGEGMERRVVISPKGGPPPRRPNYGYRRG